MIIVCKKCERELHIGCYRKEECCGDLMEVKPEMVGNRVPVPHVTYARRAQRQGKVSSVGSKNPQYFGNGTFHMEEE